MHCIRNMKAFCEQWGGSLKWLLSKTKKSLPILHVMVERHPGHYLGTYWKCITSTQTY